MWILLGKEVTGINTNIGKMDSKLDQALNGIEAIRHVI